MQYLVEESYELVEAIEAGDDDELIEELGDVLYQVLFHADIAAEAGRFTLEDVAAHMTAKMVGRHPHVFGDVVAETADAVVAIWDALKAVEKPHRTSVLDGIPQRMPSLALADKLVRPCRKVGVVARAGPARYRGGARRPAARDGRPARGAGSTPSAPSAGPCASCKVRDIPRARVSKQAPTPE